MSPQEIKDTISAFQKSRIILTAYELDIFTFIGEASHNAETISVSLHLNENATERLLNALVALTLLTKHLGNYSNTPESLMYLSKDSPEYMGGVMHTNHLWDTWSHLTDVVKTGGNIQTPEINERGEAWLEAFIHAMHDRAMEQGPARISEIDLSNVESVLDIGGGSGCFCMAFLSKKPELKTAVFDLPNVIPISKRIINDEGFSGKIDCYTGDYTKDELPSGFDLIFLSSIIHINSSEMNQELVNKCYNSLNINGQIVIHDWIMNEDKTEPVQGAIFSINMLVTVEEGDSYAESEINTWLTNAGFSDLTRIDIQPGLGQVIGIKR